MANMGGPWTLQKCLEIILLPFGFPAESTLKINFPITLEANELQLWHGPSGSFKDLGAQVCANVYASMFPGKPVLTCTSGDTGGAAIHALSPAKVPAIVLYPNKKISSYQESQMVGVPGSLAIAVDGTFDDCQNIAKEALSSGAYLSSNSISLARILPQAAFYAWLSSRKPGAAVIVPSGNMGNATAALMAKKMGAPLGKVCVATNANDSVVRYLSGKDKVYTPGVTVHTPATAMDVGHPSNWARMALFARDSWVCGVAVHDNNLIQKVAAARKVCPHTAVGYIARAGLAEDSVVVATANPEKFIQTRDSCPDVVLLSKECLTRKNRALLLVGMPGSGKSVLAKKMGGADTDDGIDLARAKFAQPNDFFRTEQTILTTLCDSIDAGNVAGVVATGGSVVHGGGAGRLRQTPALVVWLRIPLGTVVSRCGNLAERGVVFPEGVETVEQLFAVREGLYKECADLTIDTAHHSIEATEQILKDLLFCLVC